MWRIDSHKFRSPVSDGSSAVDMGHETVSPEWCTAIVKCTGIVNEDEVVLPTLLDLPDSSSLSFEDLKIV